ncbi:MAG TPA: ROK family protein, partial [Chloroflexota bacterium]|nr:ROK family protein [Chloroflexota bacterium]
MMASTPAESALALGIDIGGTKIAVALVDASGTVLARARGPVAPESNDAAVASIFAVVDQLLASEANARQRLSGIGAGAPGSIDWRRGVFGGATNLAWRDLALADSLRERYGVPALLDNDVNVAAWGELSFGGWSVPIQNLVFIAVGTGIGCGIIESGRIVRGRRSAGEIGHIPIFEHGPQCKCGMIGCLEAVASGPALGSVARALVEQGGGDALLGAARAAGGGIEQ